MSESTAHQADTSCSQLLRILTDGARAQMGIIREALHDLAEPAGDPARQELLERVRRSVWQLGTLMSDVTDFHAYSAGQLDEPESDFDLRVTLDGVRERLPQLGAPPGWQAAPRIRHDVPTLLRGRPARLQDILLGVGSEVMARWPEGVMQIDVSMASEQDGAAEILFRCELRPSGQPSAAEIEQFQARLSPDGAGPRLDRQQLRTELSRRLAMAASGQLDAVKDGGLALAFELRLRFVVRVTPSPASDRPEAMTLRSRRALIADVSGWRRNQMRNLLQLWGLEIEACAQGTEALEALRRSAAAGTPFDLVLVDAEFEESEGAGRRLRDEATGRTRMILLYGVGMRGDAALAQRTGFEAYLPRTISIHELREAMEILLRRAATGEAIGPIVTQHSLADVRMEGVQILLVSEDSIGSLVIESVLRRKGFHVDRAKDMAEGCAHYETSTYDFLILDLENLSDADQPLVAGLQVVIEERGRTPIAVLVGPHPPAAVMAEIRPDVTFTKPADLEQICVFCERALYPDLAAPSPAPPPHAATVTIVSALAADDESAIFEPERLAEATLGNEQLQRTVVRVYLEGMPQRIELIAASLRNGDLSTAGNEAESARALAVTVGAVATGRCLAALAHQVREKHPDGLDQILARLREEVSRSADAIREQRTNGEDPASQVA